MRLVITAVAFVLYVALEQVPVGGLIVTRSKSKLLSIMRIAICDEKFYFAGM